VTGDVLRATVPFASLAAVEAFDRRLVALYGSGDGQPVQVPSVVWKGKPYEFYYWVDGPGRR
jgi:hypothetical protein